MTTTPDRLVVAGITYAWLALSAITVLSWWLAPGHGRADAAVASVPITIAVVAPRVHQGSRWSSGTSWRYAPHRSG